jgi:hypothetical protein
MTNPDPDANGVIASTWGTLAIPILREIRSAESEDARHLDVRKLAERCGVPPSDVTLEATRLFEDGYFAATVQNTNGGADRFNVFSTPRLKAKGARAIGLWPSSDADGPVASQSQPLLGRRSLLGRAFETIVALANCELIRRTGLGAEPREVDLKATTTGGGSGI